jgi:hypothetical protein
MDAVADGVQGSANLAGLRIARNHRVLGFAEVEIVGGLFEIGKVRQIVLAPAAPVGKFGLLAVNLFNGRGRVRSRCRSAVGKPSRGGNNK